MQVHGQGPGSGSGSRLGLGFIHNEGHSATLANSIIGVGILAMPFCFRQCGICLSILLLLISGFMTRLACHLLLKSSVICKRRNFEVLAYHVFGGLGKFSVDIGVIGFLMGTCVAYFVVVGDLGPQIIAKMLNMNHSNTLRTGVMIVVSIACVLPLGLLKNLDSFSNVSAATIGFYFCLIIKIITEAINQIISGEWIDQVVFWRPEGVLQCLPIFSMALCCQTQLFEIYDTLPGASIEKMNLITKSAVNICTIVYILIGFFGYVAFSGQTISGNILTNLTPSMASDVIKVGFVLSLAFSFPLIIFPCRSSLYSLLYKKGQVSSHDVLGTMIIPERRFRYLTVFIIAISLIVGLILPNIELVLGLVGSTIGIMICVIFPAACFICLSIRNTNERISAQILLMSGILIMVLGTYANLQAVEMDEVALENKVNNLFEDSKINDILPLDKEIALNMIQEPKKDVRSREKNVDDFKEKLKLDADKLKKISDVSSSQKNPINITSERIIPKVDKLVEDEQKSIEKNNKVIEDIKNQKLLETMKKHEEEQRKMVDEQKEILLKLEEMKKEDNLKMNKDDDKIKNDRNKIAVESIQKLAKIAIDSLNGDNKQIADIVKKSNEVLQPDVKLGESKKVEEKPMKSKVTNEILDNSKDLPIQKENEKLNINNKPINVESTLLPAKSVQVESPDNTLSQSNIKSSSQKSKTINTTEISHAGGKRDILEISKE